MVADHAVGALGDIGRHAHQLVGRLRVELRVGAEELEIVLERALEPALAHRLSHCGIDPRDFLEADLVDLLGAEVERRELTDIRAIISVTLRHFASRKSLPRLREIFVADEAEQLAVGGHHRLPDRRRRFPAKRLPFGRGDGRRHVVERLVE